MHIYYPVTAAEIGHAVTRDCSTMAIREQYTTPDGRSFPLLVYGSPVAYEYVQRNGLTYGVYRYDGPDEREFRTMP